MKLVKTQWRDKFVSGIQKQIEDQFEPNSTQKMTVKIEDCADIFHLFST